MFRATGYRRSLLPWDGHRPFRTGGAAFAQRPIRLAAATAVAGLLVGNAVLVYELTGQDAGPVRQETATPGIQSAASELRSALEAVEAEIRANVGRLTVRYGEASDPRSRSQKSRAAEEVGSASQPDGGRTASTSTSAASDGSPSGSSSTESHTEAGPGGSSGGSSGGDTSDDSTSGSSSGSSGGSGTGGTGGAAGGGGGGGGGGGDVSGGGGSGGGGGG